MIGRLVVGKCHVVRVFEVPAGANTARATSALVQPWQWTVIAVEVVEIKRAMKNGCLVLSRTATISSGTNRSEETMSKSAVALAIVRGAATARVAHWKWCVQKNSRLKNRYGGCCAC